MLFYLSVFVARHLYSGPRISTRYLGGKRDEPLSHRRAMYPDSDNMSSSAATNREKLHLPLRLRYTWGWDGYGGSSRVSLRTEC
jgi:hypothetical protein